MENANAHQPEGGGDIPEMAHPYSGIYSGVYSGIFQNLFQIFRNFPDIPANSLGFSWDKIYKVIGYGGLSSAPIGAQNQVFSTKRGVNSIICTFFQRKILSNHLFLCHDFLQAILAIYWYKMGKSLMKCKLHGRTFPKTRFFSFFFLVREGTIFLGQN